MSPKDAPEREMYRIEKLTAYRDFQRALRERYEAAGVVLPKRDRERIESHVLSHLSWNLPRKGLLPRNKTHWLRREAKNAMCTTQSFFRVVSDGMGYLDQIDVGSAEFWNQFGVTISSGTDG